MKAILRGLVLSVALAGICLPAQASLRVEPFLGYHMGKDDSTAENDITGTEMGARVGFSTLGFAVGGELSKGLYDVDSNPSADLEPTNMGVFAAFEFPILLRVYGTYIVSAKSDFDPIEVEGSGVRLGVGFTGLPFVAINFEYLDVTYDECSGNALVCSNFPDYKTKLYGVNVSLPLDLL